MEVYISLIIFSGYKFRVCEMLGLDQLPKVICCLKECKEVSLQGNEQLVVKGVCVCVCVCVCAYVCVRMCVYCQGGVVFRSRTKSLVSS